MFLGSFGRCTRRLVLDIAVLGCWCSGGIVPILSYILLLSLIPSLFPLSFCLLYIFPFFSCFCLLLFVFSFFSCSSAIWSLASQYYISFHLFTFSSSSLIVFLLWSALICCCSRKLWALYSAVGVRHCCTRLLVFRWYCSRRLVSDIAVHGCWCSGDIIPIPFLYSHSFSSFFSMSLFFFSLFSCMSFPFFILLSSSVRLFLHFFSCFCSWVI